MEFKYSLLGLFGGVALIILLLSMIPAIKLSGNDVLTGYNATNISDLNILLDSPPYENDYNATSFNCSHNATRTFNVTNSLYSLGYMYSQVMCAPDLAYNGNITVSFYWNDTLIGTSNLTECNDTTRNDFVSAVDVGIGSGLINYTVETNHCPVNAPLDNLYFPGNDTCTDVLEANGQCLRYFNNSYTYSSGNLSTAENVFLSIIVLFMLLAALVAVIDKVI